MCSTQSRFSFLLLGTQETDISQPPAVCAHVHPRVMELCPRKGKQKRFEWHLG